MKLVDLINGKTSLFGVLGSPIEHTKSPYIHNTLFKELNINAVYLPIHVKQGELESAVKGLRAQNYIGFNVTVPYKKEIIRYLDDIANDALLMGAVNTVKNVNGKLKGYNTDAEGFVRDFTDGFETQIDGKSILLLGAGGTARALAVKLAAEGAKHLTIVNRTYENCMNLVDLVKNNYGNMVSGLLPEGEEFKNRFLASDIVINTTPAGMSTYLNSTPFELKFDFKKEQLVYDVVYAPPKTAFIQQAEAGGCKTRNGFGMLINQGIAAFEIWTGKKISREKSIELLKLIKSIEEL